MLQTQQTAHKRRLRWKRKDSLFRRTGLAILRAMARVTTTHARVFHPAWCKEAVFAIVPGPARSHLGGTPAVVLFQAKRTNQRSLPFPAVKGD